MEIMTLSATERFCHTRARWVWPTVERLHQEIMRLRGFVEKGDSRSAYKAPVPRSAVGTGAEHGAYFISAPSSESIPEP